MPNLLTEKPDLNSKKILNQLETDLKSCDVQDVPVKTINMPDAKDQ